MGIKIQIFHQSLKNVGVSPTCKGHFGSAIILGLCLLMVNDQNLCFETKIPDLLATCV